MTIIAWQTNTIVGLRDQPQLSRVCDQSRTDGRIEDSSGKRSTPGMMVDMHRAGRWPFIKTEGQIMGVWRNALKGISTDVTTEVNCKREKQAEQPRAGNLCCCLGVFFGACARLLDCQDPVGVRQIPMFSCFAYNPNPTNESKREGIAPDLEHQVTRKGQGELRQMTLILRFSSNRGVSAQHFPFTFLVAAVLASAPARFV